MMKLKKRILVVDDNADYRQLITYQLTKAGYEVFMSNDGQEAISWLRYPQLRPDLVILDLLMPRMSGLDVLERIKTLPDPLPVILVSGAEGAIARQGVILSDPSIFLSKPFSMEVLLSRIETLLPPVPEAAATHL